MKAFVPVVVFVPVTFLMLVVWIEFSGAAPDLRPWLYLVRALSWLIGLVVASLLFAPVLFRNRLRFGGAVLFAVVAVFIFYPCDGFLTAHAEEHVIQERKAHGADIEGTYYMYGEFSGMGYSRGALDALSAMRAGFLHAAVYSFIWFPIIFFAANRLYRPATNQPTTNCIPSQAED